MKRYIGASGNEASVGIWWYTDGNQVIGVMCDLDDGYQDGRYIQYSDSKNHMNLWKPIVCHEFSGKQAESIYNLGYRGFERGRVIYDTMTQVFIITCSKDISSDKEAISAIKNAFSLDGNRCELEVLNHYTKLPLTGNPAVDDLILNMDV